MRLFPTNYIKGLKMQNFTVTKMVEYIFTIEAGSHSDAEKIAAFLESNDADQWTILDINAENDDEFAASITDTDQIFRGNYDSRG